MCLLLRRGRRSLLPPGQPAQAPAHTRVAQPMSGGALGLVLLLTSCQGQPLDVTPFVEARTRGRARACSAVSITGRTVRLDPTSGSLSWFSDGLPLAPTLTQPWASAFPASGCAQICTGFCFCFSPDKCFLKMWSLDRSTAQNRCESAMLSKRFPHPFLSAEPHLSSF